MKTLKSGSIVTWVVKVVDDKVEIDTRPSIMFVNTRQEGRERVKTLKKIKHAKVSMHKCIVSKEGMIAVLPKKEY